MTNPQITSHFTFFPECPRIELPVRGTSRLVNREQGQALEQLAHAIEYLEDELIPTSVQSSAPIQVNDRCEAIEALRLLHRSLWYSLPVKVPLWRRVAAWHHGPAQVITLPSA